MSNLKLTHETPSKREGSFTHTEGIIEIWVEEPWVQWSNWGHWKPAPIIWLLKNKANSVTVGDGECPGVRAGHYRPQAPPSIPGHNDLTGPSDTHKDLLDLSWCIFRMIIYLNFSLYLPKVPSTKKNSDFKWTHSLKKKPATMQKFKNTNVPKLIFLILLV
jgi:hypothetical protein